MKHTRILTVAALTGVLAGVSFFGTALQSSAEEAAVFDTKQTEAIQGVIKDYLVKNPKVLREALGELKKLEAKEIEAKRNEMLSSFYKGETPLSSNNGSGKGKVTLVEFFDYNCGPCRQAFQTLTKVLQKEKDFRIVFVDLPILSQESVTASQAAIAASKQGKYFELHRTLMSHPGMITEEVIFASAKKIGLDVEKLKKDMNDPEIAKVLERNNKLASYWGLRGTPGFIIGDTVMPGMDHNFEKTITDSIAKIRKDGCKAC
ncbi:MAG: DsbA family protein [Alphaproteobacteria bacterium]